MFAMQTEAQTQVQALVFPTHLSITIWTKTVAGLYKETTPVYIADPKQLPTDYIFFDFTVFRILYKFTYWRTPEDWHSSLRSIFCPFVQPSRQ